MCVVDQDQMNALGFAEGSLYATGCNRAPSFWYQNMVSSLRSLVVPIDV
jgi:3-deoxy-D-manno-octulosonic acid (KDO) 8-phosphate synthase